MAKTKVTARKSTGPHGVPRYRLAPRNHEIGKGSSKKLGDEGSSSNPANIKNLTKELNTLRRAHAKYPGEVENEEEEDPVELVYFSDEDDVSSDMGTNADD
jgi:hypothetical protein